VSTLGKVQGGVESPEPEAQTGEFNTAQWATEMKPAAAPAAAGAKPPAAVQKVAQEVAAGAASALGAGPLNDEARQIIERIAWEVVPELAETIIKAHLEELVRARQGG
jgi:hypothetical protein